MADFNAKINLDADNSKALRKIEQVEKAVNKLDNAVNKVDVKVRGTQQAEQQVNKLYKALERLESSALSKLPQSLQMVIAYLKAANAGMGEFSKRAIMAAAAVGDIGRVSLAPIVRAQTQAITQFNKTSSAIQKINSDIVKVVQTFDLLLARIVAVRVQIEGMKRLTGGGGGGGFLGGGGGGGGRIGPGSAGALPPGDYGFLGDPITLRGLRNLRSQLEDLLDTAVIGSQQFRRLEDAIADVNNRIRDAQLVGQRGGSGVGGAPRPFGPEASTRVIQGSVRALEQELAAKQALVNNAVIGTKKFREYSRSLQRTTRQLERAQSAGKGFFSNLTNPQSKLGSAVIGGGFPLITGGGPGSILGGALGGLAGGFAGSIGGSAIGQSFDQATAAVIKTAEATRNVGNAFDFLSEKQLFSSDETRRLAEELAELGEVERLAAVATAELVNIIGNQGVQNLQELDSEWQELLSNVAELGLAIAAFISQYLKPVIELLNNAVGSINTRNRFDSLRQDLAGTAQGKALEEAIRQARRDNGRGARLGPLQTADQARLLEQFGSQRPITVQVPVTDADRDRFAPPKAKAAGKSDEDRIRERIELLNIEIAAIQQKAAIDQKISQARIAEDQSLVNRLTLENQLVAIQERLAKTLVRTTDERVKQLEIAKAQAQAEAAKSAYADKEAERIAAAEQSYTKQIEILNLQLQAAEAITREEQQQAELQLKLLNLRNANKDLTEEQLQSLEAATKKLFEATNLGPLAAYIKNTSKALADTEARMVRITQTIENQLANGIANFFNGIVDGSKSAEEAFADMLTGMGQALVQEGARMIAQYIAIGIARMFAGIGTGGGGGGFGPTPLTSGMNFFRAEGGPVDNATPYIVGERGPELFVPNTSGTVINSEQSRAQLDMYSPGNAVDAPAGPMNVNMQYSGPTMAFDDKRYLPIEAVPEIIKDAAKQGEQRALSSMRNRVSTRNRVGI